MPDGELKLGPQQRSFDAANLTVRKGDGGITKLAFSASSEQGVDRWYGKEVLEHSEKAVRLDRVRNGNVPLLFNHDWSDPIGMIDSARLVDGRMEVEAHLFATARVSDIATMIDGGLRNISIGYRTHVVEEEKKSNTFTARDWEPYEISVVTVPADPTIGIGRAQDEQAIAVRVITRTEPNPTAGTAELKGVTMTTAAVVEEKPAAGGTAVTIDDRSAVQVETDRIKAIDNICDANNIAPQTRAKWKASGAGFEVVSRELTDILKERGKDNPTAVADIGLTKREVESYSLFRMMQAVLKGDPKLAGFETRCHEAVAQNVQERLGRGAQAETNFFVPGEVLKAQVGMQKRDIVAGTGAAGGFLVETANVGFIELLRNRSVVFNMGATRLSGLSGNVAIPRQTAGATAGWMSTEAGAGAALSDQTFGQLAMTPKTVVAATQISRQLQLQSDPSAEGIVMMDLAKQVALAVDSAALSGTGASGQPTGIINTAGIGGFTGTSITYVLLLDSQTDLALANTLGPSCGYVAHPAATTILMTRQRFASTDTPLWEGSMLDGRVIGFRAMTSNQMPASRALFGDFSQVVIGEWGVLELAVNPVANFLAGIIAIRAMYSVDVGVRYPAAFSYASNNVT
jgi:HK97 family phage major capsid protein/HK97 family phage prohead protease